MLTWTSLPTEAADEHFSVNRMKEKNGIRNTESVCDNRHCGRFSFAAEIN